MVSNKEQKMINSLKTIKRLFVTTSMINLLIPIGANEHFGFNFSVIKLIMLVVLFKAMTNGLGIFKQKVPLTSMLILRIVDIIVRLLIDKQIQVTWLIVGIIFDLMFLFYLIYHRGLYEYVIDD